MNTMIGDRKIASRLQRAFMSVLVVMILFGSLPVGRAQASSGPIIGYVSVKCAWGKLNHQFAVTGNYQVAYRVLVGNANTNTWTQTAYYYYNSNASYITYPSLDIAQRSGSTIVVMTDFWWLNGNTWVYYGRLPTSVYAVNTSIELDNHNPYCTIG